MSEPTKPGSICRWIVGGPVGLPPGITEFRIPAEVYWCGDYFLCRGETWTIVFGGVPLHLQDRIGLKYIQVLLANPGRPFHVHDLIDECLTGRDAAARGRRRLMDKTDLAESNLEEGRLGDAGEVLDDPALRSYRDRLRKLASEREEADKVSDIEWLVRIDDETVAIERQLRAGANSRGRPRRYSPETEKQRKYVQKHIARAIQVIRRKDAALGRHLKEWINTGSYCHYSPRQETRWTFHWPDST